jgi:hypothetical protein
MPRRKKEKLIGLGLPANLLKEFIDLSYKGNTSIAPEGYEIDAPLSDSRVKVYQKKGSKEVIITHRGSVGLQDWMDNAKFLVAGKVKSTKSYQLHRDRHLKAVEKYGAENIIGVGHSRAGLYLQELQKEVPIKEIITYNKAVGFYDALRTNPEEQTDVKVKNDFVSLLSGLQKRKNKMVEIDATSNPLDFNKAHQAEEISKLGDTFIGKKEEEKLEGSGRAPSTKTLEQLKKKLKTLEKQLINIEKGKVYKTTNKEKATYDVDYTKRRIRNYELNGIDLIETKKKANPKPKKEPKTLSGICKKIMCAYGLKTKAEYNAWILKNHPDKGGTITNDDLVKIIECANAKKYCKTKEVKPKPTEPKPEPKPKPKPKPEPKKPLLIDYKEEGKLDFLKLGENYTKMDFSTAINNYIRTNNLQSKTNEREFRIDKNLSKLFNIEENKIITYFQSADLFRPTIKELFKDEPNKEEPKPETKPEPKPKPITLPEPEPTKQDIKPLINKLKNTIEEFEKVGREHGAVFYDETITIASVAYIALLLEYEGKCAIIDSAEFGTYTLSTQKNSYYNRSFMNSADELGNDLLGCIKRGDPLIVIPLSLRFADGGHANLLIYRPFQQTIERYEPHGAKFSGRAKTTDRVVNEALKEMFEVKLKPILKEYTPKFISQDQICPNPKGFQAFEGSIIGLEREGGGFCSMWSLFVLELVFINPNTSTKEILAEALAIAKADPKYLKNVIRGYVLRIEKLLDDYIKKIDANDGFSFEKSGAFTSTSKYIKFQEVLLNLLLTNNNKGRKVEILKNDINRRKLIEEDIKKNKETHKDLFKLIETLNEKKLYELINSSTIGLVRQNITPKNMSVKEVLDSIEQATRRSPIILKNLYHHFNMEPPKVEGGYFWESKEVKEEKKAKKIAAREAFEKERQERSKARREALNSFAKKLNEAKKNKKQKGETAPKAEDDTQMAKSEDNTQMAMEEGEPAIEGGIFGFSAEEKARKQEYKEKKAAYAKEHHGSTADYVFSKSTRKKFDKEYYAKKNKAQQGETAPKAIESAQQGVNEDAIQQGVEAEDQEALGSGFYYLKEISEPTNPIFRYKKTYEIPTFIDPETEFLLRGGAFTDMAGMNCDKTTGQCFNPVWEKEKIKKQILSEYKIWYNPFKRAPPGTILMAWLPKMIEDRYKPLYDEFVARRNVNIGLPADASRERFEKQMFSNLTDGLSYVPIFNTATSLALTAASTLTDTKNEDGT